MGLVWLSLCVGYLRCVVLIGSVFVWLSLLLDLCIGTFRGCIFGFTLTCRNCVIDSCVCDLWVCLIVCRWCFIMVYGSWVCLLCLRIV